MTNVDVDLEKLSNDLENKQPTEVARFAPAKYRTPTSLTQWQSDIRRKLTDAKQLIDDALRDLG